MRIYKLRFISGIHIGIGRLGYDEGDEFIRSDTLMGALASAWSKLYGEDPSFIYENSPFLISSAFPYYRDTLFLPVPSNKSNLLRVADSDRKKIKKLKWISVDLLKKVRMKEHLSDVNLLLAGKFVLEKDKEFANPLFSFKVERVTIDRVGQESTPYSFQEVKFIEGGGLYFIAEFREQALIKKFEAVLDFLGDEGIGADRTVGKGFFRVEKGSEFSLEDLRGTESNSWYLLSLFIPTKEEIENINLEKSYFSITRRGGWVTSGNLNLRKRNIWAIEEGSILFSQEKPIGKNPVVLKKGEQIDFNIYRWGKALVVPWRLK